MKAEVFLDEDYKPAEDEPFMNERQIEYFRRKLLAWRNDLLSDSRDTIEGMKDSTRNIPDVADRASEETARALELRTRDRERKLIQKINEAISANPAYIQLQSLEALKSMSKDPAAKIYFLNGDSPAPLPLLNLGEGNNALNK